MAKFLCNGLPSRTTDWSKWRVFFCDERHVPFTDPECTYTIYKSKLVDNGGPLPGENIFPINPDLSGKVLYLQSRIQVYMLIRDGETWKWHRFLQFPITCSHLFLIQRFQIICQKNSSKLIFVLVHHKHTKLYVLSILCWKFNIVLAPSLIYSGGCSPGIQGEDPGGVWRSGPPKIPSAVTRNGTRWTHLLLVPWAPSS